MIIKDTTIIATEQNIKLLGAFFEANKLEGIDLTSYRILLSDEVDEHYVHTEHYYGAIRIQYDEHNEHVAVILTHMSILNNGLNNMLIDYLIKAGAFPIVMAPLQPKTPTIAKVEENFRNNIMPKLKNDMKRKYPNVKIEAMIK